MRDGIRPGDVLRGPAIVCEPTSTAVIDPGWQGEVLSGGELLLTAGGGDIAVGQASSLPIGSLVGQVSSLEGKKGQAPFVRSTLRAVPANGACPLFPCPTEPSPIR